MGHLKNLYRALAPNPFIQILKKQKTHTPEFLFFWNRGLGDIPLELYPLFALLKTRLPSAKITVVTRQDLKDGFLMLDKDIRLFVSKNLTRKQEENYSLIFDELSLDKGKFDHIFYKPDPTYWAKSFKKNLICKLNWQEAFVSYPEINSTKPLALLHIHSETVYHFEKNLPDNKWHAIISDLKQKGYFTIALGLACENDHFDVDLDMRGKTALHEIISLMLKHDALFIGPDSGLLNMLYYLDVKAPIHLVSFWGNPKVGLLRQATPSPNPLLDHKFLIAKDGKLSNLDMDVFLKLIPDIAACSKIYFKNSPMPLSLAKKLSKDLLEKQKILKNIQHFEASSNVEALNPEYSLIDDAKLQDARIIPIILAGGQGTRLGTKDPKALFEIEGQTLLSYFAKKIKNASLDFKRTLKAYMIVSKDGYPKIKAHLEHYDYYGLNKDQLILIIQNELPFVTEDDQFILNENMEIQEGPNGNGEIFQLLSKEGIFDSLPEDTLGFEIIPIDNPLAPMFSQFHAKSFEEGHDVSIFAIKPGEDEKNFGKLAIVNNKIKIIEYTDLPPEHLTLANTGLLGFNLDFAKKLKDKYMPLHVAKKSYRAFSLDHNEIVCVKKFETFIFDHLMSANKINVYLLEKKGNFQPLKTQEGPFGIAALKKCLLQRVL